MFQTILWLHIAAGTVGLVIGPISMFSEKRKGLHTKIGSLYFYLMALVCLTAVGMAVLHWSKSWWFTIIAGFSFMHAGIGYRAVQIKGKNWLRRHISGMLGSYIAMTTALLVVNAHRIPSYTALPRIFYWLLPTIIGTPLILMTIRKYTRPKNSRLDSRN